LPEHYFLPKTNIAFTVIPKTGCTSLKNYLIDLERQYSARDFDPNESQYLNMAIHSSKLASRYLISAAQFARGASTPNILVLRNPYDRALSAWMNKLLYAQDDYGIYNRLKQEPFTPVEFDSIEDLNIAFEKFAERLFENRVFLDSDRHWKPQHTFVKDLAKHQIVLETNDLSSLQVTLSRDPRFGPYLVNKPVPRFNSTRQPLLRHIGTDRAWDLIERTYNKDFRLLEQAGLAKPVRPNSVKEDQILKQYLISQEKPFIEKSRSDSETAWRTTERDGEMRALQAELEAIKSSKSWRWTAPLRKLGALVIR